MTTSLCQTGYQCELSRIWLKDVTKEQRMWYSEFMGIEKINLCYEI